MVRLAGLEPATCGFEVRYSIQLSYRRIKESPLYQNVAKRLEAMSFFKHGLSGYHAQRWQVF